MIGQGLDIVDQAVTDKDKFNELKYTLAKAQAQLMMSGPGQSITKITICVLVSLVVGSGTWVFLKGGDMEASEIMRLLLYRQLVFLPEAM